MRAECFGLRKICCWIKEIRNKKLLITLFFALGILSYSSEIQIIGSCECRYKDNSKVKFKNYDWDKLGAEFEWDLG